MKYIEYDITTGRILSEITCEEKPEAAAGTGLLQIHESDEIDPSMYVVLDGRLEKTGTTSQEKLEQRRIKLTHMSECRRRLRSMQAEYLMASLADDKEEINRLRREFREMSAYL